MINVSQETAEKYIEMTLQGTQPKEKAQMTETLGGPQCLRLSENPCTKWLLGTHLLISVSVLRFILLVR